MRFLILFGALIVSTAVLAEKNKPNQFPLLTKQSEKFFWPPHTPENVKTCSIYRDRIEFSEKVGNINVKKTLRLELSDNINDLLSAASKGDMHYQSAPVPETNLTTYGMMTKDAEFKVLAKKEDGENNLIYVENLSAESAQLIILTDALCK